jgi:outer membrane protein assembly factor BamB
MPKRPSLALVLLSLALFAGCASGTPATNAPTPTGPRPPVPLGVYLSTNFPQTTSGVGYDALYAFNASDGSQRWQHNTGQNFEDVALGTSVIYLAVNGVIHAIDTSNNQELWHYKTGEQFAPLIADGRAILALPDADQQHTQVLALDANTGATLWQTEVAADTLPDGIASPVGVVGVAGGMIFLSGGGGLKALNETNGALLWNQKIPGGPLSVNQVSNGLVYVIGGGSRATLLALNASDGSVRWQFPKSSGVTIVGEQTVVANGNVFLVTEGPASAQVIALKGGDGSVRWQKPFQHEMVDTWFMDQNGLYVGLQGTVQALNASDGSSKWQRQISTGFSGIGAAGDGVAYSESPHGGLVFFHTSDGSVLWHFPAQDTLELVVQSVNNNMVFVTGKDSGNHPDLDTFYALSAADGSVRWKYAVGGRFDVIVG